MHRRPCGLMDKALVLGTKDCRFESCQGHTERTGRGFRSGDCSVSQSLRDTDRCRGSDTHSKGRRWCQAIGPVWGTKHYIPSADEQLWVVASWQETQTQGEAAPRLKTLSLLKNHECQGPPGWCGRLLDIPAPGLGDDSWSQTAGRHPCSGLGVVRKSTDHLRMVQG